jgi:hypothetical protein
VEGADSSTVRLDRVEAGRDLKVSATTVQVFVGTAWKEDRVVSVAPDGSVRVAQGDSEAAPAPALENPYKGLEAFHEADADRFFGREAVIDRLWQRCGNFSPTSGDASPLRLLPVIGPSGCGKSSLVRAGLLPELARRPVTGLAGAQVAVLVPGSHPVEGLAAVLARMITGEQLPVQKQKEIIDAMLASDMDNEYHGLRRVVRFLTGQGRPLIIVVDQFEEIWSLCESRDERAAFVGGLLDVAADRDARVSVVLTLRSDFLASTSADPALSDAISRRAFLVPSMSEAELRCAIAEPARRAGFAFAEATIDLMVAETEGREGALPLLEFALTRIWEGLKSSVPAAETLRQLGGVGGALAKEAERIYQQLPGSDQRIVRRAFLAQVRLGEGTRDSRRRAPIEEIVAKGEDREHVLKILRDFSQPEQRFITLGGDPSRGAITAELSHEALLEHWDSLRNWIAESRDDLRFQRRLSEAAEEWNKEGRPRGLLWRSPALDLLRAYHRRSAADMPPLQVDFLEQSERQQLRERQRRYSTVIVGFGVLLTVALIFLRQNYVNWEETRPWARFVRLSTGLGYPLAHDTANVGRAAEGVRTIRHQVALPERRISRIHLSISNAGIVSDWRSVYGTTVNSEWLSYGDERQLTDGDVLVLSSLEAFRYEPIIWRPWHYLWTPEFANEPAIPGWAFLIDGANRAVRPIQSDEAFIRLRDDRIEVSEKPAEDAVLVVRRRLFREYAPLAGAPIEASKLKDEDQPATNYVAGIFAPDRKECRIAKEISALTIQPSSTAKGHHLSGFIKEGDYDQREIVLPSNTETVLVVEGGRQYHGLGEIIFESETGSSFQVVPNTVADIVEITSCDND